MTMLQPGRLRTRAGRRHLTRQPWQLILSVLGVSLGVAVVVAMDLAIGSSREAFRVSSETVAGRATHQIVRGIAPIPDSLPARLRIEGGLREVAPVVEGWAISSRLPDRPLRLLGVDPFAEPPFRPWLATEASGLLGGSMLLVREGAAILGRETAEAAGLDEGDALPAIVSGREVELLVAGILDPEGRAARQGLRDLVIMDIAQAQELLGQGEGLDRIDLVLAGEGADEGQLATVRRLLPPGVELEEAGAGQQAMQEMIRAFDLNLRALSLLALVFGVFLIYNTMTFSVVRRRGTLGTLRALGATRGQVVRDVLSESALVGLAGSLLGLLGGILLGRGLVRLVTRTINDLYFVLSVEGLHLPPGVLIKGAALGLIATVLAALPAAWEAGSVPPREAMARSSAEGAVRRAVPRLAAAGGLLALIGGAAVSVPGGGVGVAFAGLFAVVLGMAMVTPGALVLVMGALRPISARVGGVIGGMAARGVVTSLSRTAPAVVALVMAVSVVVGLGTMIHGFRGSVERWLQVTLQADLYVSSPSPIASRAEGLLPQGLPEAVEAIPEVTGVSTYRGLDVRTLYGPTRIAAVDLHPKGEAGLDLIQAVDGSEEALRRFRGGEGVLVSEPFSIRHDTGPGERVRLEAPTGSLDLPVLGVFRDYGTEMGVIMLPRTVFDGHWRDRGVTSMGVFLSSGADGEEMSARIRALAGADAPVVVRSNAELRRASMEVFDRTFAITGVLQFLAAAVAFIAVLSALTALQLERRWELGVLRANGMTPGQTWGLVTTQTGLMGLVAGVLALPVGLVLAVIMVFVVNRRSFGWTLDMIVPPELLAQAVGLAVVGALLAGIHPAWRMTRTPTWEALRGE